MSITILKRIAVSEKNFNKLRHRGLAGDSFNDVVTALLEEVENKKSGVKT
jgi:hypothetical protein